MKGSSYLQRQIIYYTTDRRLDYIDIDYLASLQRKFLIIINIDIVVIR